MTTLLIDAELARFGVLLGVVLGVLIYNRFGVTTGGAIVPGYLALFVARPSHIAATFCIALLTYYLVHKILRPRLMLWGNRLFEAELLTAFVLQLLWIGCLWLLQLTDPVFSVFTTIGFILPGIIAHDMGRQGATRTLQVTLACTAIVFMGITAVSSIRTSLGILPIEPESAFVYENGRIFFAIGVSVLAAILLRQGRLRKVVGTGGFVTAAYLALLLERPLDILIILAGAAITYLIVTQILMEKAIIFGRGKVAAMILIGVLVTWTVEFLLQWQFNYTPWPGLYVIVPMMMALLANDTQRRGAVGTLAGASLATAVVFLGGQLVNLAIKVS